MTHLTDTQSILLSTASRREGGSLLPLPASLKTPKPVIAKSIAALLARGLIEKREVTDQACVHRNDGDGRYRLVITAAGLSAIGAVDDRGAQSDAAPASAPPVRSAKSAMVIALLQRADGATMPELIAATDWLPHTTRAALTGLRKKGHVIERTKREGSTCYTITAAA